MPTSAARPIRLTCLRRVRDVRGFSFPEVILVAAIIAIVGAVGVPAITNMLPSMRVGMSARAVERQLQMARLKAVQTNRTIRVRFNCPGPGQYRMVELIGTPKLPAADDADGAAVTRCGYAKYPYPDPVTGTFDIPNHDGPINVLDANVAFTNVRTIEFRPNGTAHVDAGSGTPWPQITEASPAQIQVKRTDGTTAAQSASIKTIEVNGLGRISIK